MKENHGVAVHVLRDAGLDPEAIRDEVLRGLGNPQRVADVPGHSTSGKSLDQRIESMGIRERLMSERLLRLREELAVLRAERERLHGPAEPPEQP